MEGKETIFKMAFSFLKKADAGLVRALADKNMSPEEFFSLPTKELSQRLGIRPDHSLDRIQRDEALSHAKKEYKDITDHNIHPLFILDNNYPSRLAEIEDPPVILYQLGDTDLDTEHVLSIVGTRRPTPYGTSFCKKIITDLAVYFPKATVVSGLALGIDAAAHITALESNLPTVAIVAHGLNMIYPANHRQLAKRILKQGGSILTEYPFGIKPFKGNFLARNRIVAALSDITVIVESALKGGAMSTANYAFAYSREVGALPGRISDELSSGCNYLIRKQKASLVENALDIMELTGWKPLDISVNPVQRNLFPELEGDTKVIYELLKFSQEPVPIDTIAQSTGLHVSKVMALLSEMEFEGVVIRYPGTRYSIS